MSIRRRESHPFNSDQNYSRRTHAMTRLKQAAAPANNVRNLYENVVTTSSNRSPINELIEPRILKQPPTNQTDTVGNNYCTFAPNYECYSSGWPSCCGHDEIICSEERPNCDATVGESYCTFAPDYDCFPATGWPECCGDQKIVCSEERPDCDSATKANATQGNGKEKNEGDQSAQENQDSLTTDDQYDSKDKSDTVNNEPVTPTSEGFVSAPTNPPLALPTVASTGGSKSSASFTPLLIASLLVVALCLLWKRRRSQTPRGDYRRVAAAYTDSAFGEELSQDDYLSDDDVWDAKTVEMPQVRGRLKLQEING
jgi:hypothetical protein